MKSSMQSLGGRFSTSRMLTEYSETFYLPALKNYDRVSKNSHQIPRDLADYTQRLRAVWDTVSVFDISGGTGRNLKVGESFSVECRVHLGEIAPEEVSVQLYTGRINAEGDLVSPRLVEMKPGAADEQVYVYKTKVRCEAAGRQGYAVRVVPSHRDLVHPYLPGLLRWNS